VRLIVRPSWRDAPRPRPPRRHTSTPPHLRAARRGPADGTSWRPWVSGGGVGRGSEACALSGIRLDRRRHRDGRRRRPCRVGASRSESLTPGIRLEGVPMTDARDDGDAREWWPEQLLPCCRGHVGCSWPSNTICIGRERKCGSIFFGLPLSSPSNLWLEHFHAAIVQLYHALYICMML
jgi:hypothetical protein